MLQFARFALLTGLAAAIPAVSALDPPQHPQQEKKKEDKKKAEPADNNNKKGSAQVSTGQDHFERRNSRMKERNREIDGILNKQKR